MPVDPEPPNRMYDVTRRTYLAEERTLLAWWRTGLAVAAVALAVGGLLPKVEGHRTLFIVLGIGYGVLALLFVGAGSWRARMVHRALADGGFVQVPMWMVVLLSCDIAVLVVCTVALFV